MDRFNLEKKLIETYKKQADYYDLQLFEDALIFEVQANKLEKELNSNKFDPFYNTENQKFTNFVEYVEELQEQYLQTIFEIKESTGEGNYGDIEKWNIVQIFDYINRKEKQVKELKAKNGKSN